MVSISNLLTGAILLGGISAFMGLGGFKGIGSKLGQGFGEFGTSLISGLQSGLPSMATTQVKTYDPYPEYLASAGTGDGILEVTKKAEDKYCVGGFCFKENPNLAASALPPATTEKVPSVPSVPTTSGSLAHTDYAIPSGAIGYGGYQGDSSTGGSGSIVSSGASQEELKKRLRELTGGLLG
jgi:hypothetical protein